MLRAKSLNPLRELVLDTIEAETEQVMQNMKAVLQEAGMTFEHIVKTTIFIIDMSDFAKINTVYGSYFNEKTLQLVKRFKYRVYQKM
jgi:2-iminobutanoate/2-iminopropanoate deaminase